MTIKLLKNEHDEHKNAVEAIKASPRIRVSKPFIEKEAIERCAPAAARAHHSVSRKKITGEACYRAGSCKRCWVATIAQLSVGDFTMVGDTWSQHLCDTPDAKPFMLHEVTPIVTTVEIHELVVVIINLLQDGSNYN